MTRDTDVNPVIEALDHLMSLQEQQAEILTHLEQREVPDITGLARRLEDIADAVERLTPPEVPQRPRWLLPGAVILAAAMGWWVCWSTVRWLPSGALPPGFTRAVPAQQKGRF